MPAGGQHLRDLDQARQIGRLVGLRPHVNDQIVRPLRQELIPDRQLGRRRPVGHRRQPLRGAHARHVGPNGARPVHGVIGRLRDDLHPLGERAAVGQLQFQGDRSARPLGERSEQVHGVAGVRRRQRIGDRLPYGGRPDDASRTRGRREDALEVAVDAFGHVFPRRYQLAGAAGRFGERADERLGDRAADADRKDAMAGPARLIDGAPGLPHFAVGDQQQVARHAGFSGDAVGGPQRGLDLRAAHVGVQAAHEAARAGDVGRGRRRLAAEQRAMAAAERDDVEQVAGPQAFEYPLPGDPHLGDRVAAHRSGAVDDDLEVAVRCRFGQVGQLGPEARQDDPASSVAGEQRPAIAGIDRRRGARLQHHVAVHRRRPGDLDHRLPGVRRDRDVVRRRCPARPLQRAPHRGLQPKGAFGVERVLRRLMRGKAAGGRIAVPRGDGRRQHEPDGVAVPAQQKPVPEADGRRLARSQVADVRGVEPRL